MHIADIPSNTSTRQVIQRSTHANQSKSTSTSGPRCSCPKMRFQTPHQTRNSKVLNKDELKLMRPSPLYPTEHSNDCLDDTIPHQQHFLLLRPACSTFVAIFKSASTSLIPHNQVFRQYRASSRAVQCSGERVCIISVHSLQSNSPLLDVHK